MNDYKDLIEDLRLGLTCGPYRAVTVLKSMLSEAADAIEQLIKERDAAVADIIIACRGENTLCGMCGNKNCDFAGDNQTYCYKCSKFKWRGVQEVEHE